MIQLMRSEVFGRSTLQRCVDQLQLSIPLVEAVTG
jgi:hypothetical protein